VDAAWRLDGLAHLKLPGDALGEPFRLTGMKPGIKALFGPRHLQEHVAGPPAEVETVMAHYGSVYTLAGEGSLESYRHLRRPPAGAALGAADVDGDAWLRVLHNSSYHVPTSAPVMLDIDNSVK